MARNRYDVDEVLETPFDFAHLKRSFVYIKKYKGKMITALVLSVFAAISGLLGPLITQYALDNTIPQKNMGQLVLLTLAFVGTIAVSIWMKKEAITCILKEVATCLSNILRKEILF